MDVVLRHALPLLLADQQQALVEALVRPPAFAALPRAYRHKLLRALATAPLPDEAEVHEALLDAFLNAPADAEAGWSTSTYEVGVEGPLSLRVFAGIGGGNETGGRVWDAALALSAYLLDEHASHASDAARPRARVALELGAGPGLPGLLLAALGAVERVVLTDAVPATLDNLRGNVARLPAEAQARCAVCHLNWFTPPQATAGEFDSVELLLAADVVYEPSLVPPLLATIRALLDANPGCTTLLAAERRGEALATFERELGALIESGALHIVADRSEAAHRALRAPSCPFYCAPEAVGRIVLLELARGAAAGEAPTVTPTPPDSRSSRRVVTRVTACSGASVRATVCVR